MQADWATTRGPPGPQGASSSRWWRVAAVRRSDPWCRARSWFRRCRLGSTDPSAATELAPETCQTRRKCSSTAGTGLDETWPCAANRAPSWSVGWRPDGHECRRPRRFQRARLAAVAAGGRCSSAQTSCWTRVGLPRPLRVRPGTAGDRYATADRRSVTIVHQHHCEGVPRRIRASQSCTSRVWSPGADHQHVMVAVRGGQHLRGG